MNYCKLRNLEEGQALSDKNIVILLPLSRNLNDVYFLLPAHLRLRREKNSATPELKVWNSIIDTTLEFLPVSGEQRLYFSSRGDHNRRHTEKDNH